MRCRRKWVPFTSSARSDGATFEHWQKEKDEKDSADYAYARWDILTLTPCTNPSWNKGFYVWQTWGAWGGDALYEGHIHV